MRIAVASGKGGTGKTTVATGLAVTLSSRGVPVRVLDCDVEEPNAHLFLRPELSFSREVTVLVPEVDEDACTGCGVCGEVCAFHAIVPIGEGVLLFPELCHACGACSLLCPEKAIREVPRAIGVLESGVAGPGGAIGFAHGRLDVGEAKAPPVIAAVTALADVPTGEVTIIDAPPGTSCPVIAAVRGADLVMLVAEPTPFGVHDLRLAVEMVEAVARAVVGARTKAARAARVQPDAAATSPRATGGRIGALVAGWARQRRAEAATPVCRAGLPPGMRSWYRPRRVPARRCVPCRSSAEAPSP